MSDIECFDLNRVKHAIEENPSSEIFIISGNMNASKLYEERIREHLGLKQKIRKISNHTFSMDGLNFINSIVLLCGYWWQNKNANTFLEHFNKLTKIAIPITYIPPISTLKGGGTT